MNKYEPILYLKSPKLIHDIIIDSRNNQIKVELTNVIKKSVYDVKPEKKNKINNKNIDFIENKHNKNKHKKKIRNKIYIDKNLSDIKEELDINEIKSMSFIKNAKNTKNRRHDKDKVSINSNTLVENESHVNEIYLNDLLTVKELSVKLNISSTDIIKWLFLQGISVTINQLLDISISTLVAEHYSFNVIKDVTVSNPITKTKINNQSGQLRAPIVTLLGHVDHGKTTLLRSIKKDKFFREEAGDITQGIGAYEVFVNNSHKLIFLDTPGHEAFISMRERGADITDIVVLVVSADDGLKPQTIEAIEHIQNRSLPFVVAINKIDKPEANLERVRKQLMELNISDKDMNNNNIIIGLSALNNININLLLSALIDVSKSLNLKSDPLGSAEGTILEAYLNKRRGPVAQLLVQNGTLNLGEILVAGKFYGKIKAMHNSMNQKVSYIKSTSLVNILCFTEVPAAGLAFRVVENEKSARLLAANYKEFKNQVGLLNNRISLDDLKEDGSKNIVKKVNLIIKTNTQGSIDAIMHTLTKLPQEKVQLNLLFVSCGEVSLNDIDLAYTSNSIILVFNLSISSNIFNYACQKDIFIKNFNVIYDLTDYIKQHMLKFVDLNYEKNILGYAEVKNLFMVNKKVIAGCFVKEGKLRKNSYFHIKRLNKNIYKGSIDSLKRVKEDVDEVYFNNDCGVMCKDYSLWEIKDILECYELKALEKTL